MKKCEKCGSVRLLIRRTHSTDIRGKKRCIKFMKCEECGTVGVPYYFDNKVDGGEFGVKIAKYF